METKWIILIVIGIVVPIIGGLYYLVFAKGDSSMTLGSSKLRSALVKVDKRSNYVCSINLSFITRGITHVIPGIVFTNKNIFLIFQFRNKIDEKDYVEVENIIGNFKKVLKLEDKLQIILLSPSKTQEKDGYIYTSIISYKKLSSIISMINSSSSENYYDNNEIIGMLKRISKAQK